jgi:lysophospholipase L1-like esterase
LTFYRNVVTSCELEVTMRLIVTGCAIATCSLWSSVPARAAVQEYAVRLKTYNNQNYLSALAGGAALSATGTLVNTGQIAFTLIDLNGAALLDRDEINLRHGSGYFVAAEGGGGGLVNVNRGKAGEWETFVLRKISGSSGPELRSGDAVAIQTFNGRYIRAEGGGGGSVNASSTAVGPWEIFVQELVTVDQIGTPVGGNRPPPTQVTAQAPGPISMTLSWQPPSGTGAVRAYWVYRDGRAVGAELAATQRTFSETGLEPKHTYTYQVAALYQPPLIRLPDLDLIGMSPGVRIATPPALPPDNFRAELLGQSSIRLSWTSRPGVIRYGLWRNGFLVPVTGTSYTDNITGAGTYSYSIAAVYRLAEGGEILGERSEPLVVAPRPLNVAAIGDSIMWGQGLRQESKFASRVAEWLRTQLQGRPVNLHHVAHSGAVIGFAENPDDEFKVKRSGEVPFSFPTIAYQARDLLSKRIDREQIDLVLFTGCINDVGIFRILTLDPTVGAPWVAKLTKSVCGDAVRDLLDLAAYENWFPNAKIAVTGYFQILSEFSDAAIMLDLVRALDVGGASLVGALTALQRTKLITQSAAFHLESTTALRDAVEFINTEKGVPDRAAFVDVQFRPENSYGAYNSWLFRVFERDEVFDERKLACEGEVWYCGFASTGHPNPRGAQAYADAIGESIKQWIPDWRANWTQGAVFAKPQSRRLYVLPEYRNRTPDEVSVVVRVADSQTGAGLQGWLVLKDGDRYPLNTQITLRLMPQLNPIRRNKDYGGMDIPKVTILAPGYSDLVLDLRPPILRLAIQTRKDFDTDPANPTVTVRAMDERTGRQVEGTVILNGDEAGRTGELIALFCPDAIVDDDDEEYRGRRAGAAPARQTRSCGTGVVQAPGYRDASFRL